MAYLDPRMSYAEFSEEHETLVGGTEVFTVYHYQANGAEHICTEQDGFEVLVSGPTAEDVSVAVTVHGPARAVKFATRRAGVYRISVRVRGEHIQVSLGAEIRPLRPPAT